MAKEHFDRSLEHVNIGTIGHVENNTIVIDHAISASSQSPLSKEAIKLWLFQSGLTENKSIETPNP